MQIHGLKMYQLPVENKVQQYFFSFEFTVIKSHWNNLDFGRCPWELFLIMDILSDSTGFKLLIRFSSLFGQPFSQNELDWDKGGWKKYLITLWASKTHGPGKYLFYDQEKKKKKE